MIKELIFKGALMRYLKEYCKNCHIVDFKLKGLIIILKVVFRRAWNSKLYRKRTKFIENGNTDSPTAHRKRVLAVHKTTPWTATGPFEDIRGGC